MRTYYDTNGVAIKNGDILKYDDGVYDENGYPECGELYVVKMEDDELIAECHIGQQYTNELLDKDTIYENWWVLHGVHYQFYLEEFLPFMSGGTNLSGIEIIGNIIDTPERLSVEYAKSLWIPKKESIMERIYKIRRTSDGLYSSGGTYPYFNKNGKIWKQLGHLKSHVNQFVDIFNHRNVHVYDDCEVVEIEMAEKTSYPFKEFMNGYIEEVERRNLEQQEVSNKYRKEYLQRRLEEIKEELEKLK